MDDNFAIPSAGCVNEEDMMDLPDVDSPVLKVGEEKEIGKQGLKKKLLKEGEGWDTPNNGDEVEDIGVVLIYAEYLKQKLKARGVLKEGAAKDYPVIANKADLLELVRGIVVTKDGNAILCELDLVHPAAKTMIELNRTQDEEVGDGSTSVIVLAGKMLHVAEAFIDQSFHPTVICRAYVKALEDAIAVLDKIAMHVDLNDRAMLMGLVKSCIGTKFTSQFGDLIIV